MLLLLNFGGKLFVEVSTRPDGDDTEDFDEEDEEELLLLVLLDEKLTLCSGVDLVPATSAKPQGVHEAGIQGSAVAWLLLLLLLKQRRS